MKNSRIILAIAVIICFGACGSQTKTEKTTASKKIEGFKSYENEWYSIQYPADWAFYLTSDSSTLATIESYHYSIYLNQYDSTNVLNLMKIQIVDAGISLLELTEELKDEYDTVYLKKINDQPCCVSLQKWESNVCSIEYRFIKDRYKYAVVFIGREGIFEKNNMDLINKIVSSFRIK